jgi:NAD(P)-dependent dehydrogenase (short-subunit alcohol dehydrogenase family)
VNDQQVAVVTGGARGIGFAVASELAERGYRVVILDNGVELDGRGADSGEAARAGRALAARGGSAEGVACDVADPALTRAVLADIAGRYGRVDVLANMAGILRPGPFLEDTPQTWAAVLSTHLGGHLNTIGAVLPGMLARGSGRIINVTSTAGLLGSRRQPAYSTAKQAIVGLTRWLAPLLKPSGVWVNAVSPAAATRMSAGLASDHDERLAVRLPPLHDRDPAHVGRFAGWLAGPAAAGITGRIFLASGHYIVEYEHLRLRKWSMLPPPGGAAGLAECLRWVIGRPHPTVIGPWPTRDFRLAAVEPQWEGTAIGPDLVAGTRRGGPATRPPVVLGAAGGRLAARLALAGQDAALRVGGRPGGGEGPGGGEPDGGGPDAGGPGGEGPGVNEPGAPSGRAAGALVFAPERPSPDGPGTDSALPLPDSAAVCAEAAHLLGLVRSGLAATAHHDGRSAILVLPGGLPWTGPAAGLARWLAWYAATGLVRGAAATEAMYGVRANGLVVEPGGERLAGLLAGYLLSSDGAWLNGFVLTADDRGVGVLSDESPRWQAFVTGDDLALPAELGRELGIRDPG